MSSQLKMMKWNPFLENKTHISKVLYKCLTYFFPKGKTDIFFFNKHSHRNEVTSRVFFQ